MSKEPRWMRIKLKEAVFKNSLEKQDITKAAPEWIISHHYTRQGSTCVCGQHPITECSIIKNIYTGKMLDPIGNECIHYFQDQNLDYQLKTWQTQDNKIRGGPYAGMSFDIVADQHPGYTPSPMDLKQYATLRAYMTYRNMRLRNWDTAIATIRPRIMARVMRIRQRKLDDARKLQATRPKCLIPQCETPVLNGRPLCRTCYYNTGVWVRHNGRYAVSLRLNVKWSAGDRVWVKNRAGEVKQVLLDTFITFVDNKPYPKTELWTYCQSG